MENITVDRSDHHAEKGLNEIATLSTIASLPVMLYRDFGSEALVDKLCRASYIEELHHPVLGPTLALSGALLVLTLRSKYFRKAMSVIDGPGGRYDESAQLMTGGAYKFSRNPIYLGYMITGSGLVLSNPTIINVCILVSHFILQNILIGREEKNLARIFGLQFTLYKKRVGRWLSLPSLSGKSAIEE